MPQCRKNRIFLARIFNQRPSALEVVIRKADGTGKRVGTLPFQTREDMLAHLRDHPAGQGLVYDLSDKDLTGADLSDANFSGAILHRTQLTGANLSGADFYGAQISDSDFTNTRMIRTNIAKSTFKNTSLEGATLRNINAGGADLEQIGRVAADLEGVFHGFYTLNGRRIQPPGMRGRPMFF